MSIADLNNDLRALLIFERQFPNLFDDLQNVRCMNAIVRGLGGVHRKNLMPALKIIEDLLKQGVADNAAVPQPPHQLGHDHLGGKSIGGGSGNVGSELGDLIGHGTAPGYGQSASLAGTADPSESGAP